jgi:ankyrin repeat protein
LQKLEILAEQLVAKCPSSVDAISSVSGEPLLHMIASSRLEEAAFFLIIHRADVNALNRNGESTLHVASRSGLTALTIKLLQNGADSNLQTPPLPSSRTTMVSKSNNDSSNPFDDEDDGEEEVPSLPATAAGLQTALHMAVLGGYEEVILAFVEHSE